jgi:TolA-binding protein
MRPGRQNPTRLAELPPEDDLAGVALLIQSARQSPDEPLPLVKWRIRNSLRRRSEWNRRGLRLALVGALVFFAGSVVGAIALPLLRSRLGTAPPEPAETHPSAKAVQHSHRRVPVQAIPSAPADQPIVPAEPPAVPALAVPQETGSVAASDDSATAKVALAPVAPVAAVARASNVLALHSPSAGPRKRAAPASLEPPPPVEVLPPPPDEHSLLATAVRRLRTAHDPASALAALDDYRVRFPSGALAPEASMLRAEALLQIGRKSDALAELDGLSLAQMPNSDGPHVLRGELRAAAGRWREALADFDVVLRGHAGESAPIGAPTDAKAHGRLARALWGRALARSRLGDDAGARADLQECLRRFPRGRFAPEAARLLGEPH